jgi:hypothetical protein
MLYWTYADTQILRIGRYIKDEIEMRTGVMHWEQVVFARRFRTWNAPIPSWLKKYKRYEATELSALATFAGTTVAALLLYLFLWIGSLSNSMPTLERKVDERKPDFSWHIKVLLAILDLPLIVCPFYLISYIRRDYEERRTTVHWEDPDKPLAHYEAWLEEHQRRFKCRYPQGCKNFSRVPVQNLEKMHPEGDLTFVRIYWDIPTELNRCSDCGQWFCELHYVDRLALCHADADRRGLGNLIEENARED